VVTTRRFRQNADQRQAQGYVVPDSFTHGSSAQRSQWFTTGLKSGDVASCDTFRTE
jgi:predicted metalloprotease